MEDVKTMPNYEVVKELDEIQRSEYSGAKANKNLKNIGSVVLEPPYTIKS